VTDRGRPLRVGFIGTGAISSIHARALSRVASATLTAVYDTNTASAEAFARRWDGVAACETLEAMWQTGVDVVHVLTPPASHAALTLEALAHGCHVYVEKPLATAPEDCDRIHDAARRAGRKVCVGHSLLRDPTVVRLLKKVRRGAIGDVRGAEYVRSQPVPTAPPGVPSAFLSEGGFPMRDAGIHGVYLLEALVGPIRDVNVRIASVGRHQSVLCDDWHVLATGEHGMARLLLSYSIQPWQSILTVYGSRGTLRADLFASTVTVRRTWPLPSPAARLLNTVVEAATLLTQSAMTLTRAVLGRLRQFHGVQDAVTGFYEDLDAGREPMVTPLAARTTVEWTERIAAEGDRSASQFIARFTTSPRATILVTGATGLVGRPLVARLLGDGHAVRVLARRQVPDAWWADARVEPIFGDLGDRSAVDRAVAGTSAVFHLGATMRGTAAEFDRGTIDGTRHVVDSVVAHRVPRLVYVSSLSVLHAAACTGDRPIDEEWPLEPAASRRGHYTRAKLAAEQVVTDAVKARGLPAMIVRPGAIIASPVPQLTSGIANRLGRRLVVLGNARLRVPLIVVDDVVDALVAAAERGPFDGMIVHLVDPAVVTQNDLIGLLVAASPTRLRVVHVPRVVVMAAAVAAELVCSALRIPPPISRYRIASALAPRNFVSNRATRVLGWEPRVGIARFLGLGSVDQAAP
jgi:predicted dehydrogenase/nucleoside-diphosphate-sugar epimerase